MLSKARRLSTREFAKIMETGREARSPLFIIRFLPSRTFKLSPAAPKKLFPTAVSRNRARRRIYAAVREIVSKRKAWPNIIVIIVKNKFDGLGRAGLVGDLEGLFVKAGLVA